MNEQQQGTKNNAEL